MGYVLVPPPRPSKSPPSTTPKPRKDMSIDPSTLITIDFKTKCSYCGTLFYNFPDNYKCPNCGAQLNGKEEEEEEYPKEVGASGVSIPVGMSGWSGY